MTPTQTLPRGEIQPAWRAAVLAYRRELRATHDDLTAPRAACAAFREVLPQMPDEQAKLETTHAIPFAAREHTEWFLGWRVRLGPPLLEKRQHQRRGTMQHRHDERKPKKASHRGSVR